MTNLLQIYDKVPLFPRSAILDFVWYKRTCVTSIKLRKYGLFLHLKGENSSYLLFVLYIQRYLTQNHHEQENLLDLDFVEKQNGGIEFVNNDKVGKNDFF